MESTAHFLFNGVNEEGFNTLSNRSLMAHMNPTVPRVRLPADINMPGPHFDCQYNCLVGV
jgi:hypothetical protein